MGSRCLSAGCTGARRCSEHATRARRCWELKLGPAGCWWPCTAGRDSSRATRGLGATASPMDRSPPLPQLVPHCDCACCRVGCAYHTGKGWSLTLGQRNPLPPPVSPTLPTLHQELLCSSTLGLPRWSCHASSRLHRCQMSCSIWWRGLCLGLFIYNLPEFPAAWWNN